MLRKELRLGLTIGGVILAVVVVWVIAVSGSSDKKQARDAAARQVDLASNSSTSADAARTSDVSSVTLEPLATNDQRAASTTQPAEATASNDARANKGDLDWGKLLNGDQPMLMQSTPSTPTDGSAQKAAEATPDAQPAPAGETQTQTPGTPAPAAEVTTPPATAQPTTPAATADPAPQTPELPSTPAPNQQVAISTPTTPAEPTSTSAVPPTERGPAVDPPTPTTISNDSRTSAAKRTHVVQKNETLSTISTAAYGNANYYPHILRANPGLDPKRMKVGTTIILPDVASVKPESRDATVGAGAEQKASATSTPQLDPSKEYKVQPNDSLYKIAQKLYGKSDLSTKIYDLNKDTIGPDPAKLKLGMVLKLPSAPTVAQSR